MTSFIQRFIAQEYFSGILLIFTAILALMVVNSPLQAAYFHLLELNLGLHLEQYSLSKPFLMWINEGFMTIFFFLVGLEIKRELFEGELNTRAKAILPFVGAIGGMLVPSIIFALINRHDPIAIRGWAIPSATDIAFALGILCLFGKRLPLSLKIFLTALAIIDDLGAIIIIALFYSSELSWLAMGLAGLCLLALIILNRLNITRFLPYLLIGAIMWICVLKSGVHATLTGVVLAFVYPLRNHKRPHHSLAQTMEERLLPWVNYGILPLFAFANAGVPLNGVQWSTFFESIPLGTIVGLVIGKQIGILGSCWLAVKMKWAVLPTHASWRHLYAVAILCGIGFTMSLFIGSLAYDGLSVQYVELVRLGVLMGAALSVLWASLYIFGFCRLPRVT